MQSIDDIYTFNFENIPIDIAWNMPVEKEIKIHRIHAYPAKFPAFVTTKAINYAESIKLQVGTIADIFCGCGTTAIEARRNNINYWGCDINPVATLIAKTKSRKYQPRRLQNYFIRILHNYNSSVVSDSYDRANERLKYWYKREQYNNLVHLKQAILRETPDNDYRLFFLCAFSNILKAASVWLTKSIKPQVDPQKKAQDILTLFTRQFNFMFIANNEIKENYKTTNKIITGNFLDEIGDIPKADMIITSPPYVTSYEYADLHQLSTLWLEYIDDYKKLRKGTIGSLYHEYNFESEYNNLNKTGKDIVSQLKLQKRSKARSVAKYFLDMQKAIRKTYSILNDNAIALFVIGNTEYKGVKIENARHLAEALVDAGYKEIVVTKRKISKKILTPYRDKIGRFTSNSSGRKVYNEEFILIGRKK
jgi:methylase of polypeptide subunit release factors